MEKGGKGEMKTINAIKKIIKKIAILLEKKFNFLTKVLNSKILVDIELLTSMHLQVIVLII